MGGAIELDHHGSNHRRPRFVIYNDKHYKHCNTINEKQEVTAVESNRIEMRVD